jgi:hypothetical protein
MGKVRTGLAVSLDGFISGPNDGAEAAMGDGGERRGRQGGVLLRSGPTWRGQIPEGAEDNELADHPAALSGTPSAVTERSASVGTRLGPGPPVG